MSSSSGEVVRCRPWLGTFVTVRAVGTRRAILSAGVERAFDAIARVHACMSAHDPDSEVSAINRGGTSSSVAVSRDTYEVLRFARALHIESDGLFDVAVAPVLARWGYLPPVSVTSGATTADLELLPNRRVRLAKPLAIDLGGIAKGYAVDLAVRALKRAGVRQGSVAAGGDLRVFGAFEEIVHVRTPDEPRRCVPILVMRNAAAATSATYFSARRRGVQRVSAIVDPQTGRAYSGRRSATVVAPTCMVADALTKIVLLDPERAAPLLRRFDASARTLAGKSGMEQSDAA